MDLDFTPLMKQFIPVRMIFLRYDHMKLTSSDKKSILQTLQSSMWGGIQCLWVWSLSFTPKVKLRKYQYPYWFTLELRHLSKCVRTLRRRISKNPTTNQLLKLSKLEDSENTKYETSLIRSYTGRHNNKIYNYTRSLSTSNSIPSCLQLGTLSATSDQAVDILSNNLRINISLYS